MGLIMRKSLPREHEGRVVRWVLSLGKWWSSWIRSSWPVRDCTLSGFIGCQNWSIGPRVCNWRQVQVMGPFYATVANSFVFGHKNGSRCNLRSA